MARDKVKQAAYMREWTAKHRLTGKCRYCVEMAEPHRAYCREHLEYNRRAAAKSKRGGGRYGQAKLAAKRKNRLFTLPRDDYDSMVKLPCHYCKLTNNVETGIGLDRLDNSKGYITGNVVSCCWLCNDIRGDSFTVEEMQILGKAVQDVRLARLVK